MDTIKIADIKIGDRRREDLGDVEALAESIRKFGLLAPPVLTDDGELVAGQRRIEAMKRLGWTETPYINKGQLTQQQLHEIELEENIRRKDFTEYEISKNMVALAEAVGKRLVGETGKTHSSRELLQPNSASEPKSVPEEFLTNSVKKSKTGRPMKPDSAQAVADEIGVPRTTLQDAREHVTAVEAYPVLESVPKMKAIGIARQADKLPEEQRGPFTEEQAAQLQRDFRQINEEATLAKKFINALGLIRTIEITRENVETWVRFEKMDRDEIAEARGDIRECVRRFLEVDKILEEMTGLRVAR